MLGPMAALEPSKWLRYALTCTIASVLGGLLGYAIGLFLMETVGNAILSFFGYAGERRAELESWYDQYGIWVIFVKGLTPIPYKLVTIVSGALSFSLPMFVIGSIITRGLRFLAVAWIFQKFGPSIAPVIEKRMGMVLIGVAVLLIAIIVFLKFAH
jgi:membrane protein YqaA with SNARE-associated domain